MSTMWLYIVSFLAVANLVASQSIIKNLPGFSGDLPFKLETGYVGVGDLDEVQLFYYFIESERSPEDDPLVLWLNGGPGCSALSGLMYEIEIGLERVAFEGDSETNTKAINVDSHCLASFGHIVVDVKDLAMNLVASSFSHVKRKGNAVADRLAKLARHFLSSHFCQVTSLVMFSIL
nr:serine carboxypeptidase-like 1 [Quercus suber]